MQKFATGKKESRATSQKAGRVISFVVGEIAIIVLCSIFLSLYVRSSGIRPVIYSDGLTLLAIACMIFVVLLATGLLKEFGHAIIYCVKEDSEETVAQIRKAAFSIKLSMITALLTGALLTIAWTIGLLYSPLLEQPEFFPPLFANASIGALYGVMAVILLLPVYARLKNKILTME